MVRTQNYLTDNNKKETADVVSFLLCKKQLSKQAKKELAVKKRNSLSWNWEDNL